MKMAPEGATRAFDLSHFIMLGYIPYSKQARDQKSGC